MKLEQIIQTIEMKFKGKATNHKGQCVYKNEYGQRCAIGLFIPEGHKAEDFTGYTENLLIAYPDLAKFMPSTDIRKLSDFQVIHDNLPPMIAELQAKELIKAAKEIFGGNQ